ncbi:MAG: site-specific integrase [Paraglaciecola sp.]|nr:site-specific integrase [Paraglaciecola sp.]
MSSTIVSRIIKTKVNVGNVPFFTQNDKNYNFGEKSGYSNLRTLKYHTDIEIPDFPLISCTERMKECLEFNLFLIERKTGAFSLKKNKNTASEEYVWSRGYLGSKKSNGLKTKSLLPIAKDLRKYLDWMIEEDVSYEEIMAVPNSYDPNSAMQAEALLPVWRFQQHLISLVKQKKISFNVGNRILSNIRAFYLWSFSRGEVNALPFSHSLKAIKIKRQDNVETLFSMPGIKPEHNRALKVYISNLSIPKSAIQKKDSPNHGLLAYSGIELKLLMNTKLYAHRTYGLFIKCALLAGLRAFEVVQINRDDVIDPSTNRVSFSLPLLRKFNKSVNLRISPKLMNMLWDYTQDPVYITRQHKFENKYGKDNVNFPTPLFINRNGDRISEDSVKNSIQKVRLELKQNGFPRLERTFHDLRATFATYWAIALIKKGYSPNDIKPKLMLLLSHETFETTQRYIDFAIEGRIGKHSAMDAWVVDMYGEVMNSAEQSGWVL